MSAFTDDDLERLKECSWQNLDIQVGLFNYYRKQMEKVNVSSLIARLECSEVLAAYAAELRGKDSPAVKAWRAAAGKTA